MRDDNITFLRPNSGGPDMPELAALAAGVPDPLANAMALAETLKAAPAPTTPARSPAAPPPPRPEWTVQAMIGTARRTMAMAARSNAETLADIRTENVGWATDPEAYGLDARQAHLAREIEIALAKASNLFAALEISLCPPAVAP